MRTGVIAEADTCREFVTPRLVEAGWGAAPHVIGEQRTFTNGRIIVAGGRVQRGKQKRADYLLYYRRDFPLAVVEAKEAGLPAETGVQQAREYAEIFGLKFAYATNGHRIIESDDINGTEREVERYATPDELFVRLKAAAQLSEGSPALAGIGLTRTDAPTTPPQFPRAREDRRLRVRGPGGGPRVETRTSKR